MQRGATCVSQITKRPSGSASATCSSVTRQALCLVPSPPPTHLLDAYRDAGLFSLTLAPHFTQVAGIGLSDAICIATRNAELDALAHEVSFRSGERRASFLYSIRHVVTVQRATM
ncbi:hypothetical protein EDB85DRAFT_1939908, partial [Lactarius pseudohatsudake]